MDPNLEKFIVITFASLEKSRSSFFVLARVLESQVLDTDVLLN